MKLVNRYCIIYEIFLRLQAMHFVAAIIASSHNSTAILSYIHDLCDKLRHSDTRSIWYQSRGE